MPGIVASFDKKNSFEAKRSAMNISSLLYNSESFDTKIFSSKKCALVVNSLPFHDAGIIENEKIVIGWFGNVFFNNLKVSHENLGSITRKLDTNNLSECIAKFAGHFQLFIYAKDKHQFIAISDKVSSHPCYYFSSAEKFFVTPEVLSLKEQFALQPDIRKGAVYEFMMSGHLWGNGTYLHGVERLGPGQYLHQTSNKQEVSFYYKHTFPSVHKKKSIDEYSKQLYIAINKDFNRIPEGKRILTLSGGYDSRALLGFLKKNDMEVNTISYSYGAPLQNENDAQVAKYYAKKSDTPFEYFQADISDAAKIYQNICEVIRATGGESDVVAAQDALLGPLFYEQLSKDYNILLRGDEIWGWGDFVVKHDMAFTENYLLSPSEFKIPERLLSTGSHNEVSNYVKETRKIFRKEYSDTNANNLKDFIAWRHREARLLQNMAYFRRCYIDHHAPFLYDHTLETIRKIPWQYRIKKKHFKNMVAIYFPDLFSDKRVATSYKRGPDKYSTLYKNEDFVRLMRKHLLTEPSSTFEQLIDNEALKSMFERTIQSDRANSKNQNEYNTKRFLNNVLRKSAYMPGLVKYGLKKINKFSFPVLERTYLYRLFILSLALKQYENI